MTLSTKTQAAMTKYGDLKCAQAFLMNHIDGEGARTVGIYLGLSTQQADAAINAGEEFFRDQHRVETECLTCSVDFNAYVRANRRNYF